MFFQRHNEIRVTLDPPLMDALQRLAQKSGISPDKKASLLLEDAIPDRDIAGTRDQRPLTRFVNAIITRAVEAQATAIRMMATDEGLVVQGLQDGLWQSLPSARNSSEPMPLIPPHIKEPIFRRLELMSKTHDFRYGEESVISVRVASQDFELYLRFAREEGIETAYLRIVESPPK